ncbi:antibiotic biosynthesis monooxygenase [Ignatzschineria rhizosphaerae]|uniref:Antibiotic biosynthesis monooxygenase n=1 Tax=Ignatzschineria rhizosphaerae TaxID=2923279 RepID=A0ABY3X3U8_9GAMM|nr:antibiotic biosynthesis monooxygenase [Ignatzschineria rhizosphaerae]UNM96935.1 antibiotic biosynthesis monooxygenase [Ignatzschineria rhizosphaerae]
MIAVIFELKTDKIHKAQYLALAADLKSYLKDIRGFISIERFQSLVAPDKILSLSFWENEVAIEAWRNLEVHRTAQVKGRASILNFYRLRVATVIRDYGLNDREEAPKDSVGYHQ